MASLLSSKLFIGANNESEMNDIGALWCGFDPAVLNFRIPQNSAVLYSCVFACGLYFTIVRFVKRARRWALVTGDESAAIAVILPSYLPILYSAIVINIVRALVVVLYGSICHSAYIDMYPEQIRENPLNDVFYSVYMLGFEWFSHGFMLLFSERCVSHRALVACVFKSFLLSVVTTALSCVGLNYTIVGPDELTKKTFYGAFQVAALGLPLLVLHLPQFVFGRYRTTGRLFLIYSVAWRIVYISTVVYAWLKSNEVPSFVEQDGATLNLVPGSQTFGPTPNHALPTWLLVVMLFLRDILSPFFVYLVLLKDTHYWRGLPQRRALNEYSKLGSKSPQAALGFGSDDEQSSSPNREVRAFWSPPSSAPPSPKNELSEPLLESSQTSSEYENVSTWLAQPRYPPGDQASNRLQTLLDSVPVQVYIDFAFLQVDYTRLLGRGATASVFAGKLTLKHSTIRAIRSPSILSGNIQLPIENRNSEMEGTGNEMDVQEGAALVSFVSGAVATLIGAKSEQELASLEQSLGDIEQSSASEDFSDASQGESSQSSISSTVSTSFHYMMEGVIGRVLKRVVPQSVRDEIIDQSSQSAAEEESSSAKLSPTNSSSLATLSGIEEGRFGLSPFMVGGGKEQREEEEELEKDKTQTRPRIGSSHSPSTTVAPQKRVYANTPPSFQFRKLHNAPGVAIPPISRRKVKVAVKMYTPPELDVPTIEAYSKETEILTELSHPNIVPYYGLCVNPPHLCLVFAICPGGSLEKYIESNAPWPPELRMTVMCDCIRGLAYVHKMGFVHRDIKPGNFLLDENFRCMLTDFGTCVRIPRDKEFVQTDSIAGTIDHMAPEVLSQTRRNMFYGYASDVYSCAILAASILGMELPFSMQGSFQIRKTVLSGIRPSLAPCPQIVENAIRSAWRAEALERISAEVMLEMLSSVSFPQDLSAFTIPATSTNRTAQQLSPR